MYTCERWGYSLRKDCFSNIIKKLYVSIYKQISGLKKNDMKILSGLQRVPLKIKDCFYFFFFFFSLKKARNYGKHFLFQLK